MSLEIIGVLRAKLPIQQGTSKTGNQWMKQEFVIETQEQYPRKICANLWGDKTDMLNQFQEGQLVKVSFDLESREFNGRWYTDVKAWKLENPQMQTPTMPANYLQPQAPQPQQPAYAPQQPAQPGIPSAPASTLPDLPGEDTFTDYGSMDDMPF
ncbi:MAG: DUF3127 domain-containing protein [Bacteroidales bacterium]|nr:DUF3127 domain-containing protein [Bacteroidales bacterium]